MTDPPGVYVCCVTFSRGIRPRRPGASRGGHN